MDKSIMELLVEVSGAELLSAIFLIGAFFVLFSTQKKKIITQLNKWRKVKNEEEDFRELVYELKNSIEALSKETKQNQESRDKELIQYRDVSRKIRDEMYQILNNQAKSLEELKTTVLQIQEKNSETKRAEIKEKIERIYRECTKAQMCTEMQLESLEDLIEQYEKQGGNNSFVHITVQPEMYKWEVVSGINSQ